MKGEVSKNLLTYFKTITISICMVYFFHTFISRLFTFPYILGLAHSKQKTQISYAAMSSFEFQLEHLLPFYSM
ncbi:MAG: hypothetical protein PWK00_09090, partial [Coxiella burnetii]|nr:hypothetical protein [Coxiella burnetii]